MPSYAIVDAETRRAIGLSRGVPEVIPEGEEYVRLANPDDITQDITEYLVDENGVHMLRPRVKAGIRIPPGWTSGADNAIALGDGSATFMQEIDIPTVSVFARNLTVELQKTAGGDVLTLEMNRSRVRVVDSILGTDESGDITASVRAGGGDASAEVWDGGNGLYVGRTKRFSRLDITLLTAAVDSGALQAFFWDGDSWEPVSDLVDGTADDGDSMAQSGAITFTNPGGSWAVGGEDDNSDPLDGDLHWLKLTPTSTPSILPEIDMIFESDPEAAYDWNDFHGPVIRLAFTRASDVGDWDMRVSGDSETAPDSIRQAFRVAATAQSRRITSEAEGDVDGSNVAFDISEPASASEFKVFYARNREVPLTLSLQAFPVSPPADILGNDSPSFLTAQEDLRIDRVHAQLAEPAATGGLEITIEYGNPTSPNTQTFVIPAGETAFEAGSLGVEVDAGDGFRVFASDINGSPTGLVLILFLEYKPRSIDRTLVDPSNYTLVFDPTKADRLLGIEFAEAPSSGTVFFEFTPYGFGELAAGASTSGFGASFTRSYRRV